MTSEEAKKYLDGSLSISEISQTSDKPEDVPPAEQNSNGEAGSGDQPNNGGEQLETPASEDKPNEDGTATQTDEGKPEDKGNPNQPTETEDKNKQPKSKEDKLPYPKASKEDVEKYKANKAFIRQKEKYKAKIGAMQSQIDDLKAQLMKYNAVDPSKIEDEDKRLDFKMAKNTLKNKIEGLEEQRQTAMNEQEEVEAEQIHQQRVDACFGEDESSKSHYLRLLENGREKFVNFLGQYDKDNTILSYLDDCDISPLMVQVLMTNPEVLKRVVSIKNPLNKVVELRSIENRINMDRRLRSVKTPRNTQQTQTNSPAKKLPSTGSQTQAGAGKDPNPVRDANYWHNYLATHS